MAKFVIRYQLNDRMKRALAYFPGLDFIDDEEASSYILRNEGVIPDRIIHISRLENCYQNGTSKEARNANRTGRLLSALKSWCRTLLRRKAK